MFRFRAGATPVMKERYKGMMQTIWSGAGSFMDEFYGRKSDSKAGQNTQSNCFRALFDEIQKADKKL